MSVRFGLGLALDARNTASAAIVELCRKVSKLAGKHEESWTEETRIFEESLRRCGKVVEGEYEKLPAGVTHQEVTDKHGQKVLRRRRFSAI